MTEPAREDAAAGDPERIGPYRILDRIGQGGMGVVYLAQRETLPGRVAIKVIKLGMDTREVLARFEVERHALSLMDHSHIARVVDAGVSDTGQPYFVMEHVPGLPLTEYCDQRKLSVRQRLELFVQVCDAVTHAHQKGVIHRDLTPRNILVKEENDKPVPKVIDFGLARAVDHAGVARTLFTEQGRLLGTPEYMSPEQAGLSPFDIDARTDVYSLGVILYELLVGELPIDSKLLRQAGLLEMQRCIREHDPSPPSVRMQQGGASDTHARDRGTTTHGLRRLVSQDLDWVTLKALEKDRRRRYPTVQNLADEVLRYLKREPVQAAAPGAWYRLRKWTSRHRVGVVAGGLVLLFVQVALGASLLFLGQAESARREQVLAGDVLAAAELVELYDDLWPEHSRRMTAFDAWLQRAGEVQTRLPENRQRLGRLRAATVVPGPETDQVAYLLQSRTSEKLQQAERDLETLDGPKGRIATVAARRLRVIQGDREKADPQWTPEAGDLDASWNTVQRALAADPLFASVRLWKIDWLYPLGADPRSHLQELLVVGTGKPPHRDENGVIKSRPEDGVVMVLLPPGEFWMGAQSTSPKEPGYFRLELPGIRAVTALPCEADGNGRPVRVRLDAFMIGKFEITQAQWLRLTGGNWSQFRESAGAALLPVENVSHVNALRVLRRVGLGIPTEGQWEYACRGGSLREWPWGDDFRELGKYANFADLSAKSAGRTWEVLEQADAVGIADGQADTSPIGTFAANAFGLHDMLGNVYEWTIGGDTDDYSLGVRNGDGLVQQAEGDAPEKASRQVLRGGSFRSSIAQSRSSARLQAVRQNANPNFGVRPALLLTR